MRFSNSILLVEDDEVDIMTMERAFRDLKVPNPLVVKNNGEEALEYLKNEENEYPCLILLDLHMPRMNGLEFLKEIKNDLGLQSIPVVVLTTSKDEEDILQSYSHCAAGYLTKPTDYHTFLDKLKTLKSYWVINEESPVKKR